MALSNLHFCGGGDEEHSIEQMSQMFGPGHVDQAIRGAIQVCWVALPKDRRTADDVEKEIRRIVDRALASFRQDAEAFRRPD